MPELPEVETTLRGILPHINRQTITKVVVRQCQLRWPIQSNLPQILSGKKIIDVERRGKYLLLRTDSGAIIIHLGMSGHLRILTQDLLPNKHDHVDIVFQSNKILRFTDPRRFGAFLWTKDDPHHHSLLKNLGIEPLTKGFSGKYLWLRAQGRKLPIKSLLMDSKIVAGIGNIYAAEALFEAGIYPAVPAQSLSVERLNSLAKSIKRILRHAIERGGTTLKDFINSDGKPGYFSNQLKAYGHAGLPCVVCHTLLQSMQIGQRNTVYCKRCQC
ncbi:MAG: bifunctional DNA-formamidopyrimidine glycosylase/DNA-(apurinic or apyrimidinic site) lyase [Gammaproteobacteria bacterium]|nr:bifunctional DNA-formamidopyrimidine glycosylase/DNA-(apurinic or apyrimidinic site) lyase [Gammaproteobacteria bacterium]